MEPGSLHEIAALDAEQLSALQFERLAQTLAHAYAHTPHYRRAFDAAGARPSDLRTLADLERFPFTGKADLRAEYPFGFFAVPREEIVRIHASSGTTGKPTVVAYTQVDLDIWSELVARSLRAAGVKPGMRVHVAYGYGLFTGGLGAHYGVERLGCTVIPVSGGQTERQVQLICDFEPDVIMVTPSYMLAILDEFRRQGIDPRATSLKIGVFGAEPWTEAMRTEIEDAFAIEALDIYGLSEVMGPGVASEIAPHKGGPVIWEDHFYPEVVDPDTGAVLPPGAVGELVFTSLTKQAMPVVRYRTRDLTRLEPGPLGVFRRMGKVVGRSDDMLIVRGVNLFPTQIEEQILTLPALSPHFMIEVSRPDRLDEVRVRVEAREGVDADARGAAGQVLAHQVKMLIGVTVAVEVQDPGALGRSQGKAQRVRDLRPK
jgi:phenylacetate-CoA ligase